MKIINTLSNNITILLVELHLQKEFKDLLYFKFNGYYKYLVRISKTVSKRFKDIVTFIPMFYTEIHIHIF